MKNDDIPMKTDEGLAEIKTRALGLAPRVRTALLLVDGVKSIGELEQLLTASGVKPGALELLLEKGLIRVPLHDPAGMPAAMPASTIAPMPETVSKIEVAPVAKAAPASDPAPAAEAVSVPKAAPALKPAPPAEVAPAPKVKPALKAEPAPKIEPVLKAEPALKAEPVPKAASMPKATPVPKAPPQPEPAAPASGPVGMTAPTYDDQDDTEPAPEINIPVPDPPDDMKLVVARAHLANALDEHAGMQGYVLKQMVAGCTSRAELLSLCDAAEKLMAKSLDKAGRASVIGISKALLAS